MTQDLGQCPTNTVVSMGRRNTRPKPPCRASIAKSRSRTLIQNRSEEHTSELQSRLHLVCRLLLEKKKKPTNITDTQTRLTTLTSPTTISSQTPPRRTSRPI